MHFGLWEPHDVIAHAAHAGTCLFQWPVQELAHFTCALLESHLEKNAHRIQQNHYFQRLPLNPLSFACRKNTARRLRQRQSALLKRMPDARHLGQKHTGSCASISMHRAMPIIVPFDRSSFAFCSGVYGALNFRTTPSLLGKDRYSWKISRP